MTSRLSYRSFVIAVIAACCLGLLSLVHPVRGVAHPRGASAVTNLTRFVEGRSAIAVGGGVLLLPSSPYRNARTVYLNDTTGSRRMLSSPLGCDFDLFNGMHVLYSCNPAPFYRLSTLLSPAAPRAVDIPGVATALGTRWVELENVINPSDSGHPDFKTSFFNLSSGVVRSDPLRPGGNLTVALNSPGLTTPICRPHRLPPAYQPSFGQIAGTVIRLGKIIVAEGTDVTGSLQRVSLERCGSPGAKPIDTVGSDLAISPHFVIWQSRKTELSGYLLPSERAFTLTLPPALAHIGLGVALSQRFLYVDDPSGTNFVWRMPLSGLVQRANAPS